MNQPRWQLLWSQTNVMTANGKTNEMRGVHNIYKTVPVLAMETSDKTWSALIWPTRKHTSRRVAPPGQTGTCGLLILSANATGLHMGLFVFRYDQDHACIKYIMLHIVGDYGINNNIMLQNVT